jgi:hypothetical protein
LAASSSTTDAVLSRSAAADLIRRMISGIHGRQKLLFGAGRGFRPGFPAVFFSAISLPVRGTIPNTVPWVAGRSKRPAPRRSLFPRQSSTLRLLQHSMK